MTGAPQPLAVTGATGFVGGRLLELARQLDRPLKCLARREQPQRDGVEWVGGDLHDRAALERLCEGAGAVVHIAGAINAPDAAGFDRANVEGTRNLLDAAQQAGTPRFVHVSSLAAREPELSLYGASKAKSEKLVRQSALPHVIVRPPAVYGPGDRETFELFRMARRGLVMLPPAGRLSLIHADDLSRLLLVLADGGGKDGATYEPDDGDGEGLSHEAFAKALGRAVGRRAMTLSMPAGILKGAARLDRLVRGEKARLTPDRAAYFCHPDWTVDPERRPDRDVWQPAIPTADGLRATAGWYREQGWLR